MILYFDGELTYKAYHDPGTKVIDLLSSAFQEEGRSGDASGGLSVGLDEEDNVCNFCLDLSADPGDQLVDERPERAPEAFAAEVELPPEVELRYRFDPSTGTLRMAFGDLDALSWARLGTNLIWLGIDDDSRLAAMVVEGISRDPGGKAQAAWLLEMESQG